MFDTQPFQILVITSLILFCLLCLFGIIAVFSIILGVNKIQNKTIETLDTIKDTAGGIGEAGISLTTFLAPFTLPFLRSRRPSVSGWIKRIFGK